MRSFPQIKTYFAIELTIVDFNEEALIMQIVFNKRNDVVREIRFSLNIGTG